MRYAILADIHGNLEALESVLKAIEVDHVDVCFCVGDIVGYGSDPCACIDEIRCRRIPCVAGNHDWAVAGKRDLNRFNFFAREVILWTRNQINCEQENFLAQLQLTFDNDDFVLAHSSLYSPESFQYLLDPSLAKKTFSLLNRAVCFIGHSHVVRIFSEKGDTVDKLNDSSVKMCENSKYIVNVGSVGQPRDKNPDAAYCLYDTEKGIIEIKRVPYGIEKAKKKIIDAGLPELLGMRLLSGM